MFNRHQVEQFVLDTQTTALPDLAAANPSCPDGADVVVGAVLECTVEVEGVTAPYRVAIPEPGRIEATPAKAIIPTAKVVALVRSNLPPGAGLAVDCGSAGVKVLDVGSTFPCTISDGTRTQTVNVRADDVKSAVSLLP